MFTETNKGFTIITNFGCDQHCKYCISKHHPILQNNITNEDNIDWNYLEECIRETTSPKVNLSGGGDPFFEYWKHLDFYKKVYSICQKYGKLMDIHTRILPTDNELLKLFNKIALSIEFYDVKSLENLKNRYEEVSKLTNIRIIQVVSSSLTYEKCQEYISKLKYYGVKQITFRQMFGNKKAYEHFELLKNEIPYQEGVLFLKDGEYHNYYFTTNNKLYPYFFGFTEEDRLLWMKKYEDIEQSCN